VLDGRHLVSDCGSFVYTRSFEERNRFRSTACHNTPVVDGEEINRLDPALLWQLTYDARPDVRGFEAGPLFDRFTGAHAGYQRLASPVTPVRTITLHHATHTLEVSDRFEGSGRHRVEVPFHLAPGVAAARGTDGTSPIGRGSEVHPDGQAADAWALEVGAGRVSPRYGVAVPVVRLLFVREGELMPLNVRMAPAGGPDPRT
jgi:hypothetical protein